MSTDSITIPASPRQEFAAGVVHCLPIVVGAVPFGFLLGSLAAKAGLSALDMGLMSALVFAGSSQFVAVELLDKGSAGLGVIGAILLVNLRHLLMGATLEPRFRGVPRARAGLALFFMTDERNHYVSSSLVKEVASLGGDVTGLVPHAVVDALAAKYRRK